MGLSSSETSPSIGYRSDVPLCLSMYMLDACRRGNVFSPDTYEVDRISNWISKWLMGITEDIVLPARFERTKVQGIFLSKIANNLQKSELEKMFEAIDVEDTDSIKEFIRENREKGKEAMGTLEDLLKKDEFPSFLWMEFSRFNRVFVETSEFIENAIDMTLRFTPKRVSQIRERNRLARARFNAYAEFVDNYFKTMLWYLKLNIFMEVWSCEKESELFTEKCLWTFRNIKRDLFDQVFLRFHDSISQLRQSFFRFKPQEIRIDFSKPSDWAFKQLILMT